MFRTHLFVTAGLLKSFPRIQWDKSWPQGRSQSHWPWSHPGLEGEEHQGIFQTWLPWGSKLHRTSGLKHPNYHLYLDCSVKLDCLTFKLTFLCKKCIFKLYGTFGGKMMMLEPGWTLAHRHGQKWSSSRATNFVHRCSDFAGNISLSQYLSDLEGGRVSCPDWKKNYKYFLLIRYS